MDNNRIFILGHSLGGMVAPRIAEQDSHIAGTIIMAGPTRKLEDLILEQVKYIAGLDGKIDDTEAEQIKAIEEDVRRIKELDIAPGEVVLGAGKAYWADLNAYDPAATAAALSIPMDILQGERDYQVTMTDFAGWANALEGRTDVTLESYPSLNHLFISGTGKSTPEEYEKAGNVDQTVIEDIGNWIKG